MLLDLILIGRRKMNATVLFAVSSSPTELTTLTHADNLAVTYMLSLSNQHLMDTTLDSSTIQQNRISICSGKHEILQFTSPCNAIFV